jgi:biofilm protein TabA
MIVDRQDKWQSYPFGEAWKEAFEFLAGLKPDAEEKKHFLRGNDLYVMVNSYETRPHNLEAHRAYVDIQVVLSGAEAIGWLPAQGLPEKTPYNPEKDIEFYDAPVEKQTLIRMNPGLFAVFFPWDAHAPACPLDGAPQRVKKVVIKIKKELLPL